MQLILISGFLGAGKTTLVRNIIANARDSARTAIIVNEFGAVGVDGDILRGKSMDVIEIAGGCICCSRRDSITAALDELLTLRADSLDRIVIEASGIANAQEMVRALRTHASAREWQVGPFITVLDASRYTENDRLLGEFLDFQIQTADVVVLNKTDLATTGDVHRAHQCVMALNPGAEVLPTQQCDLDVERLMSMASQTPLPDVANEAQPAGMPDRQVNIRPVSMTIIVPAGATRNELERAFEGLMPSIWRAKGFVTLEGGAWLLQYASGRLDFEETDVTPNQQIVFIGKGFHRNDIARRFNVEVAVSVPALRPYDAGQKLFDNASVAS